MSPHAAGPKAAALRGSRTDPMHSFFSLTGLEERLYVTGVLRRLLRSFPGAHGCHDPNLALSVSRADCPPPKKKKKNRQERWHKNHFRPDKSAIADTLTATVTRTRLAAPSADLHLWGGGCW